MGGDPLSLGLSRSHKTNLCVSVCVCVCVCVCSSSNAAAAFIKMKALIPRGRRRVGCVGAGGEEEQRG